MQADLVWLLRTARAIVARRLAIAEVLLWAVLWSHTVLWPHCGLPVVLSLGAAAVMRLRRAALGHEEYRDNVQSSRYVVAGRVR